MFKKSLIPGRLQEAALNWGKGISFRKAVVLEIVLLRRIVYIMGKAFSSSLSGIVACFRILGGRKEKKRKRARKKARQRNGKKGGMERVIPPCHHPVLVCCVLRPLFFSLLSTEPS